MNLPVRLPEMERVPKIRSAGWTAISGDVDAPAGVALLVFDEQPEQARKLLEAIRSTSANALADLRVMLEAFHRRTGPGAAPAEPPGHVDRTGPGHQPFAAA